MLFINSCLIYGTIYHTKKMKKIKSILPLLFLSMGTIVQTPILEANAKGIPEPECKDGLLASDSSACGYNCKRSGDGRKVACAEWPGGKCEPSYRSVSCGPPAPENWARDYRESDYDWRNSNDKDKLRKRRRELLRELEKLEEKLRED